jgi:hypothetical protein
MINIILGNIISDMNSLWVQNKSFLEQLDFQESIPEWKPCFTEIAITEMEAILRAVTRKSIRTQLENNGFHNKHIQKYYNKCMETIDAHKCWYFITINPRDDVTIVDFMTKIFKITNWKIFKKGYYVYEQRGDSMDTIGKGFHCHILVEDYTIEYKRLITRLEASFKMICMQPYKNTINVVRKKPEHAKETLEEYMRGDKQDDKLDKVNYDKIWRRRNSIKEIYKWESKTIDKKTPKMTDGRVNNGGFREGAGRPKKIDEDDVSDIDTVSCTINNEIKILEF